MVENIPASIITKKSIEEAQIRVIREALRLRYKKDSKLVSEYAGHVKNLRQSDDPEEYIKSTAIMLFPNEDAYNRKMARYRKWYQNKKDLLASIEICTVYSIQYLKKSDLWLKKKLTKQ
jgi:hypothetical protein